MKLYAPSYYPHFRCKADGCSHSCCIGWEIGIDEEKAALYRALPGALGEQLRQSIREGEDGACFALRENGRCPMLDERGLCRLILELGEGALCEICREHPRFYNAVGTHMECGLGTACEAAAALILSWADYGAQICLGESEGEAMPTDFDAAARRAQLYAALADRTLPLSSRLREIEQAFGAPAAMDKETYRRLFSSLEYLEEGHRATLLAAYTPTLAAGADEDGCERFFAYLVYRHASCTVCPADFCTALGFALLLTRLFSALCAAGLSPVASAVLLSEELEYSEENTEAICRALFFG